MIVYADILLTVNFIITYFLLLTASVISGYTYIRKRIIAASLAGAISCLYIFVQTENLIVNFTVKILSLVICSLIAFGYKNIRKLLISTLYFVMLNTVITGILTAVSLKSKAVYHNNLFCYIDINPVLLVTVSVCIYFIMVIAEYLKELISSKSCYKLNIVFKDFTLENITSYYDSGFKIKDIISNKDVMIISFEKVKKYMPLNLQKSAENFLNGNYKEIDYKFVPIMFRTLSGSGIIPAIKSKYIVSDKKKIENILVAFTSDNFTENITAIFGNDIKKQL